MTYSSGTINFSFQVKLTYKGSTFYYSNALALYNKLVSLGSDPDWTYFDFDCELYSGKKSTGEKYSRDQKLYDDDKIFYSSTSTDYNFSFSYDVSSLSSGYYMVYFHLYVSIDSIFVTPNVSIIPFEYGGSQYLGTCFKK